MRESRSVFFVSNIEDEQIMSVQSMVFARIVDIYAFLRSRISVMNRFFILDERVVGLASLPWKYFQTFGAYTGPEGAPRRTLLLLWG